MHHIDWLHIDHIIIDTAVPNAACDYSQLMWTKLKHYYRQFFFAPFSFGQLFFSCCLTDVFILLCLIYYHFENTYLVGDTLVIGREMKLFWVWFVLSHSLVPGDKDMQTVVHCLLPIQLVCRVLSKLNIRLMSSLPYVLLWPVNQVVSQWWQFKKWEHSTVIQELWETIGCVDLLSSSTATHPVIWWLITYLDYILWID